MKKVRIEIPPVERKQIEAYADASGDHNPIHLDDEFAKSGGLPSVIAHGMLSMGLATTAIEQAGISASSIKTMETKFKEKVFPGDSLVAEIEMDLENKEVRVTLFNRAKAEILISSLRLF